jgi:rod shape-determining protein MreC
MELISRHRNLTILAVVLFAQVLGLAFQLKRTTDRGPVRLIRLWAVSLITPLERGVVHGQDWIRDTWKNYFYLRTTRRENERLQQENLRLRLEQVRLAEDAGQAQRLQALLRFKEQFITETVPAQIIGTSGVETSRMVYIDKGAQDGLRPDMAVITPEGVVGKVIRVFPATAQVLEINDPSSGVGVILEKSRLQGILRGSMTGDIMVNYVMSDEKVDTGEEVLTSGGDRIFPKGLPIGRVVQVSPGPETFLSIRVKAAAALNRLEEVLVITKVDERQPETLPEAPMRAADILAQRLPTIPVKPPDASPAPGTGGPPPEGGPPASGPAGSVANGKPPGRPSRPGAGNTSPLPANGIHAGAPQSHPVVAAGAGTKPDASPAGRPPAPRPPQPGAAAAKPAPSPASSSPQKPAAPRPQPAVPKPEAAPGTGNPPVPTGQLRGAALLATGNWQLATGNWLPATGGL